MEVLEQILETHRMEYVQLRTEVRLRTELKSKLLNYALLVTGFLVAALTGWVLKETGKDTVSMSGVFIAPEVNLKGIAAIGCYVAIMELLLCYWVYQTYMGENTAGYLTLLGIRIRGLLKDKRARGLLRYGEWSRRSVGGMCGGLKYLQPLVVYGLTLVGIVCLSVLCLFRVVSEGFSTCSLFWVGLPVVMLCILGILLWLHRQAEAASELTSKDLAVGTIEEEIDGGRDRE